MATTVPSVTLSPAAINVSAASGVGKNVAKDTGQGFGRVLASQMNKQDVQKQTQADKWEGKDADPLQSKVAAPSDQNAGLSWLLMLQQQVPVDPLHVAMGEAEDGSESDAAPSADDLLLLMQSGTAKHDLPAGALEDDTEVQDVLLPSQGGAVMAQPAAIMSTESGKKLPQMLGEGNVSVNFSDMHANKLASAMGGGSRLSVSTADAEAKSFATNVDGKPQPLASDVSDKLQSLVAAMDDKSQLLVSAIEKKSPLLASMVEGKSQTLGATIDDKSQPLFAISHINGRNIDLGEVVPLPSVVRHDVAESIRDTRWGEVVAQRVSLMLGRQEQKMEMHLNPPDLGPMEVRLTLGSDQASVVFASQHAAVREALAAATPRLTALLADQGIQLVNVQVASDSLQQQAQEHARQQAGFMGMNGHEPSGVVLPSGVSTEVELLTGVSIPIARSGVSLYI